MHVALFIPHLFSIPPLLSFDTCLAPSLSLFFCLSTTLHAYSQILEEKNLDFRGILKKDIVEEVKRVLARKFPMELRATHRELRSTGTLQVIKESDSRSTETAE